MPFATNVFVNCPFDDKYLPLLRPLLFTIIYLGFEPRISLESLNSGEPRVTKIFALIKNSRYGIHDLSRIKAERKGAFYRLNMPFELGLDVGCRIFGEGELTDKRCLILETEKYRFQTAISDLSNSDIRTHRDEPEEIIAAVREWLVVESGTAAAGPSAVWTKFLEFMSDDFDDLTTQGFNDADIQRQGMGEVMPRMKAWVTKAATAIAT